MSAWNLKNGLKQMFLKVSNEETKIKMSLEIKLSGELNTAYMELNEKPRIDPVLISIPILFWITALIESCLYFIK